jgi:hypothetical protein
MLLARISTDWIFLINMPIKKYCRRIAPKSIEVVAVYGVKGLQAYSTMETKAQGKRQGSRRRNTEREPKENK